MALIDMVRKRNREYSSEKREGVHNCLLCQLDFVNGHDMRFQIVLRGAALPTDTHFEVETSIFPMLFDRWQRAYPWRLTQIAVRGYVSRKVVERRAMFVTFGTDPHQIVTEFVPLLVFQRMMLLIFRLGVEHLVLLMRRTIPKRTGRLEFVAILKSMDIHIGCIGSERIWSIE